MPSPVGHTMLGLALGLGVFLTRGRWSDLLRQLREHGRLLVAAMLLANLPDIDYLPGIITGDAHAFHHGYTHTLGWVLLVAAALGLLLHRPGVRTGGHVFLFAVVMLGSHVLADWVTADGSEPRGVMLVWPFTDRYYIASPTLFWRLEKATWQEVLQWHNVRAVAVEFTLVLPLVLGVLAYKHRRPDRAQQMGNPRS